MIDLPPEERRTFLEIHSAESEEPRLLQLEPYTKFANVLQMTGPGALYWGNRPITGGDTPARLRMPQGVDEPVDLFFDPATSLDHGDGATASEGFDPEHQPIPEVLPARFSQGPYDCVAGSGESTPARLLSPSLPRAPSAVASPPSRPPLSSPPRDAVPRAAPSVPVGVASRWQQRQRASGRPQLQRERGHRYAAPPVLYDHEGPLYPAVPPTNANHPYTAGQDQRSEGTMVALLTEAYGHRAAADNPRAVTRRSAAIPSPPPSSLIDEARPVKPTHPQPHPHPNEEERIPLSLLEKEVRALQREFEELCEDRYRRQEREDIRQRGEKASLHNRGLVTTPPRSVHRPSSSLEGASDSISPDVEDLAEALHREQLHRLLDLRALRGGR